jgi:hypothetical protein
MRWRKKSLREMVDRLGQLGLTGPCSVCGSETVSVLKRPIFLEMGGTFRMETRSGKKDPEANMLFMVMIRCSVCGHSQLFDSELLSGKDESVVIVGMTEEEEAEAEVDAQDDEGQPL